MELKEGKEDPDLVCLSTFEEDGAEGIRTPDLCVANASLSQLSYSPIFRLGSESVYR